MYVTVSEKVQPRDENNILDFVNDSDLYLSCKNISLNEVAAWTVKLFNLMIVKIIGRKENRF